MVTSSAVIVAERTLTKTTMSEMRGNDDADRQTGDPDFVVSWRDEEGGKELEGKEEVWKKEKRVLADRYQARDLENVFVDSSEEEETPVRRRAVRGCGNWNGKDARSSRGLGGEERDCVAVFRTYGYEEYTERDEGKKKEAERAVCNQSPTSKKKIGTNTIILCQLREKEEEAGGPGLKTWERGRWSLPPIASTHRRSDGRFASRTGFMVRYGGRYGKIPSKRYGNQEQNKKGNRGRALQLPPVNKPMLPSQPQFPKRRLTTTTDNEPLPCRPKVAARIRTYTDSTSTYDGGEGRGRNRRYSSGHRGGRAKGKVQGNLGWYLGAETGPAACLEVDECGWVSIPRNDYFAARDRNRCLRLPFSPKQHDRCFSSWHKAGVLVISSHLIAPPILTSIISASLPGALRSYRNQDLRSVVREYQHLKITWGGTGKESENLTGQDREHTRGALWERGGVQIGAVRTFTASPVYCRAALGTVRSKEFHLSDQSPQSGEITDLLAEYASYGKDPTIPSAGHGIWLTCAIVDKTALLLLMMMIPTYDLGNLAEKVGDDVSYQHTFDTFAVTWQKASKSVLTPRRRYQRAPVPDLPSKLRANAGPPSLSAGIQRRVAYGTKRLEQIWANSQAWQLSIRPYQIRRKRRNECQMQVDNDEMFIRISLEDPDSYSIAIFKCSILPLCQVCKRPRLHTPYTTIRTEYGNATFYLSLFLSRCLFCTLPLSPSFLSFFPPGAKKKKKPRKGPSTKDDLGRRTV
ncbi:hypothetical protein CCUS01_13872 [Colletotrichum cuscutae]|uniref:Uncharacterized protein n=1 Tax=Colletotrichum cuscutae TaxID=1209917 RepID=A0AAI9YAI5_9PEZI|nr:hypothetical protein CCUS01_13872 [Colletotrichum cuscutae]